MSEPKPRRRWLAPEVVQASPMDCGPTALYALLAGLGKRVSYEQLRADCQTDVDGTSIDTLESIAGDHDLDARQVLVPVSEVGHRLAEHLPAIAVTQLPGGALHFVLLWRRLGPWIQVMDPGSGRRWLRIDQLRARLYRHSVELPAERWRGAAEAPAGRAVLTAHLEQIGDTGARDRVHAAMADTDPAALPTLQAAVRMVQSLVDADAFPKGQQAVQTLNSLVQSSLARQEDAPRVIPRVYWQAEPSAPDADGTAKMLVRGALLVRVQALRTGAGGKAQRDETPGKVPQESVHTGEGVGRSLLGFLSKGDRGMARGLLVGTGLAAAGVVMQALLFRSLLDLGQNLVLQEQRLAGAAVLLLLLGGLFLVEWSLGSGLLRIGRHLEVRFRQAFGRHLARLPQAWFDSRPNSDLAERAHALVGLREVPSLAGRLARTMTSLILVGAGLIWLDPVRWPLVLVAGALSVALPVLLHRKVEERELLVRSHHGALSRFYLDALLGLVAARVHGAQRALRREHESLLVEWNRAGLSLAQGATLLRVTTSMLGTLGAIALVVTHLAGATPTGGSLLYVYWALALPSYGDQLAHLLLAIHPFRNAARRALEPIQAQARLEQRDRDLAERMVKEQTKLGVGATALKAAGPAGQAGAETRSDALAPELPGAPRLEMRAVSYQRSGQEVLRDIDLAIQPGEHVALVGRSGAGKSSLISLLLGLAEPSSGRVLVNGERLAGGTLARLRRQVAWLDPSVQLWNAPVYSNLTYGVGTVTDRQLAAAIQESDLQDLVGQLPAGLDTPVGEGGCSLSGGEGTRLRLARALLRSDVRLCLLDEPFRGVDRKARTALLAMARERWSACTLVCASHDVEETKGFDRVLVMEAGRLVEAGRPSALLAQTDSLYARLLDAEHRLQSEGFAGSSGAEDRMQRWQLREGRLAGQNAKSGDSS